MKFFVGLGNPENKHKGTRHNVGFNIVEAIQTKLNGGDWSVDKASEAEVLRMNGVTLVKPLTYMNLSGNAIKAIMKKNDYASLAKKNFTNLFVIYDDLDLATGKYRLAFASGPKDHHGLNSIRESIGSDEFWHVRVGVDGRKGDRSIEPSDYVLSGFPPDEKELVDKVSDAIVELLLEKIENG